MAQIGLGISILRGSVTLAAVNRSFRSTRLECVKSYALIQTDLMSDQRVAEVSLAIRTFCRDFNIKPAYAVMCLERGNFMWSNIEMPPVSKQDLKKLMQYELELHIPVDPATIYFDIVPGDDISGGVNKVVLVTSSRQVVDRYAEMVNEGGLRIRAVEPVPFAWWHYLSLHRKDISQQPYRTVIAFSGNESEPAVGILILKQGRPVVYRDVTWEDPWGRKPPGNRENGEKSGQQMHEMTRHILSEIRICYFGLGLKDAADDYGEIWVLGDPPAWWRDSFDAVESGTRRIQIIDPADPGKTAGSLAEISAAGAAMADPEDERAVNLLPENLRPVQRHMATILTGIFAGLLLSSSVLMMANAYWMTDVELLRTKTRIAGMEDSVKQILDINDRLTEVRGRWDFFWNMSQNYPNQLQILRELTRILPAADTSDKKKVHLEEYQANGNEIAIRGRSASPEGLITLLEDSPYFEKVQFDGTVSGDSFRIKAQLSRYQAIEADLGEGEEEALEETASVEMEEPVAAAPEEKPSRPGDANGGRDAQREDYTYELPRGPAFPRQRVDPSGEELPSGEPEIPPEIPGEPAPHEKTEEEVEEMKQNLLEFIRTHKEEGNVVERDRQYYEEPDPDEAAANFLEFLKMAAEKRDAEGSPEGN
ncbi:hypothetical protein JXA40_04710 [bacterium]|nr:hypothetical protein [candidate division CSSED10-310 bacterium]